MLFGRDKELEKLSEDDQAWLRQNKGLSARAKFITSAAAGADARVTYLYNKYKFDRETRLAAAWAAAAAAAPEAIIAALNNHGFDFSDTSSGDREGASSLFRAAASAQSFETWKTLYYINRSTHHGNLDEGDIISLLPANAPVEFLRFHLTEHPSSTAFSNILTQHGLVSAARLKFVLGLAHESGDIQSLLDHTLTTVTHQTDMVEILLSFKANPNASGALSLRRAIENRNSDAIRLLLPHIDFSMHGENLITELQSSGVTNKYIGWLKKKTAAATAEKRLQSMQEKYTVVDRHTLSETKRVNDTLTLTTLFNFSSGQQTTIARDGEHLAVTVTDFADISNVAYLDNMRARLAALGGDTDSATLHKNKLTPKP